MKNFALEPSRRIFLQSFASVVGKKEKQGPLGTGFDLSGDDRFGKDTWEKAEAEMQRLALSYALQKAKLSQDQMDFLFAGDLINQCISSSYGLSAFRIPFLGIFGACSTCAEGMLMAAMYASHFNFCASVTSSHFCTAERQFRYPLDYGGQRPPTAQWTVTGSGAFVYTTTPSVLADTERENAVEIVDVLPGRIVDRGISDANNMGAAMAPAAADTLTRYFEQNGSPADFDMIITGDLGQEGSQILRDLLESESNIDIRKNHVDCGCMIYNAKESDTHAGGSGCGCSAVVMAADILPNMEKGVIKDVLFLGTGALMNAMAINQKQTIPSIAHLVHLRSIAKKDIMK